MLLQMKRYDEAIQIFRDELARNPNRVRLQAVLGSTLFAAGQRDEGLRKLEEVVAQHPADPDVYQELGWAYGRTGQMAKAQDALQHLATIGETRHVSPLAFATVYAGMDDRDRAFAELERAFERRDPSLPFVGIGMAMDPIRDDPRFRAMLKRLKLDPYFPEVARK